MRLISFYFVGTLFGIILTKSEAISWYRIHEMFRFESFHMYGIIGTAVIFGAIILGLMKALKIRTLRNTLVANKAIPFNLKRHILAGSIFGLGWALMGACPGPMFILLGHGYSIFLGSYYKRCFGYLYLWGYSQPFTSLMML